MTRVLPMYNLWLPVVLLTVTTIVGCGNNQETSMDNREKAATAIDQRSYNLGVIGAFGEMVDVGVKTLALSAAVSPEEMDALIEDATQVAKRNNVEIYRETDFLVTDLFPASITEGKQVLLIYKGETKKVYMDLKARKADLIASDQYTGPAREDIARRFGEMLSYPEWKIDELVGKNSDK